MASMADLLALEEEQHHQQQDEKQQQNVDNRDETTTAAVSFPSSTSSNQNNHLHATNTTSFWQTILDLSAVTDSLQLTNAATCREGHPLQVFLGVVPGKEN